MPLDCFYKTKELHFALSDYLQAFEIDQSDEVIKYRLASVYNDLGILEYQERRYTQAEEFFSVAISYNPKMSAFYVSRAKARYMLEVSFFNLFCHSEKGCSKDLRASAHA